MTDKNPTTWLAEAAAWLKTTIANAERQTAATFDLYGRRLLVWGHGRQESIDIDPPARKLTFADLGSFAAFVAATWNLAKEAETGATGRPWLPAVLVGPTRATFQLDPFRHQTATLTLATDPAFELLEKLESQQRWMDQKTAHDLARLDLARLLPPAAAETLEAVAFKVTSTTSRTVGPMADRGVREFAQEQPAAPRLVGPFEIDAPVFTLPAIGDHGPTTLTSTISLDLSSKLGEEGEPLFRLAPITGQCRLARATALGLLAAELAERIGNNVPVYLADAAD